MVNLQREDKSALVLAGGYSRRMGQDKALVQIAQKTCLQRVTEQVEKVAGDVWIVRRHDQQLIPSERVVFDIHSGDGPLAGMESGLLHVLHPIVFVISVDLPLLQVELLRFLYSEMQNNEQYDAIIPEYKGKLYPLLGVYRREIQPVIAGLLELGRRRVFDLVETIPICVCTQDKWQPFDPRALSFLMMNTNEELDYIVHLMNEGRRFS